MKFNVGDRVRKINNKAVFDKASSTTNYTIKVYTITNILGNSIYLEDLKKPYRDFELVIAVESNDDESNERLENYNKKVDINKKQERIKRKINKEGLSDFNKAGSFYK